MAGRAQAHQNPSRVLFLSLSSPRNRTGTRTRRAAPRRAAPDPADPAPRRHGPGPGRA